MQDILKKSKEVSTLRLANVTTKLLMATNLVNIQRADYGGGEIYFDDVLIRKDGIFVLPELEALNPENLV
ncbi:Undefined function [Listeria monocytogenes N53-1]|nr:Undefined function [Listeria monocytogenes N53-1]